MALIDYKSTTQPFISFQSSQRDVASLTSFYILANTVNASNNITITSPTRLTFPFSGVYEFEFMAYGVKNTSAAGSISQQYGINGVFVEFSNSTSTGGISIVEGVHSLIFQVNSGDYFEMRQVLVGGTVSQNVTSLGRYMNSNYIVRLCDVID